MIFEKGFFGPYSPEIVNDVNDLGKKGIVTFEKGSKAIISVSLPNQWENADKTVSELREKFPDNSSIIVSALTSPNVINRKIGDPIIPSH